MACGKIAGRHLLMSRTCVVIGSGPAGLAAAWRLSNAGVRVTVLEAGPSVGGRARTERIDGFTLNTGAGFIADFFTETLRLLEDLRLETVRPATRPTIAATPRGKFPIDFSSPRGTWRFPLVPWSAKLRAVGILLAAALRRDSHLAHLPGLARLDSGRTAADWGRRRLGEAGYHYLLRAGIEPYFFLSPEECSVALAKALTRHALGWQMLAVREGTGALCDALASRLTLRTGCRAGAVERAAAGVRVQHSGGGVEADYAIVAVPAPAALRIEMELSPEDRRDLESVRYSPAAVMYFGYNHRVTVHHPSVTPMGPGDHGVARVWTLSRWIPDYVPEGKELIAVYATSRRAAELLGQEHDRIVSALREDAEEVFGRMADPDWIRLYPWERGMVVPAPGHYRRMQEFLQRPRERVFFAGDWLTGSTVEGAIRTGLLAAEKIINGRS